MPLADFHNLNLRFSAPDALAVWLASSPRPLWHPTGSTYHNTYRPDAASWRGHASMRSMQAHYASLGWDRGPHVFIAVGTQDDGIFIMTPPWLEAIHAGACNSVRFGLEVVGDFQSRPMSHAQLVALSETAAALHDWARIGPEINAHRDCMPGRTCPGDAAYAQRGDVQALLAFAQQTPPPTPRYTEDSPILGTTTASALAVAERLVKAKQHYTPREIRDIVALYYRTATPVGVNPLLCVAQMAHETGYLTSWWCDRVPGAPGRRNPAGIGVNGQTRSATDPRPTPPDVWHLDRDAGLWRRGYIFADWTQAVVAHVGRLVGYTTKPSDRTPAQQALLFEATEHRPLPERVVGTATTLKQLGSAHNPSGLGWAHPGHKYGAAISAIANTLGGA